MAEESGLPAQQRPLDRSALERVLARAAELQAAESDPSDTILSENQLLDVGREVGLAPEHLRQALAEERSRAQVPPESGALARVFGPARVHASRTLTADAQSVLGLLDLWMQREENLQVKRRLPDRMLWEPRSGLFADMRRLVNLGGRGYYLSRAREVAATVITVATNRVVVRLEADLANIRTERVSSGVALTGVGAAGTATLIALGFFVPIAVIPAGVAVIGGFVLARSHAPHVARAQLALEQLLDRLERGEPPRPGLLSALDVLR